MALRLDERKNALIDSVGERLRARVGDPSERAMGETFVQAFFRDVAPEDLVDRDPLDLYGAALAHLRFGEQSAAGAAKIRVYNPHIEQHGWQSTHSVVEIVTDDMPFLVDSIGMALNRLGLLMHLIIHPVVRVERDPAGRLLRLGAGPDGKAESWMHVEVDQQSDPERLEQIRAEIETSLGDVRVAVEDWRTILAKVDDALEELRGAAGVVAPEDLEEARALLAWVADNHFTFLGYGAYDLVDTPDGPQLDRVEGSALGIIRKAAEGGESRRSQSFAALPREQRELARAPVPLLITKANARSTVHRSTYLDYLGVRRFDAEGRVIGEHRFLGLFTSVAYSRSPRNIPLLRRKVERTLERSGIAPHSHNGKALAHVLETYPRDELFQVGEDQLLETALGIVHLQDRQRIRLFTRRDTFGRFVFCLVFVPRERYNTELRQRMQAILRDAYGATDVEFQAHVSESVLARIAFTVRLPEGVDIEADPAEVEARLIQAARAWTDDLQDALDDAEGEEEGNRLYRTFGVAMPRGYQDRMPPRAAVSDILRLDQVAALPDGLTMSLYRPLEHDRAGLRFKLYHADTPVTLSDALPMLENMGLRVIEEINDPVVATNGRRFHMHDFGTVPQLRLAAEVDELREPFHEAFARLWRGEAENDGFNRLILGGGLTSRDVEVIRTYCKYALQVGSPFSQTYIESALVAHPNVAADLARLFEARFDPAGTDGRAERVEALTASILRGIEQVASLDEDRILRRYLRTIEATLRTNAFQTTAEGGTKPYLSIKLDPARVPGMPLPRPAYEIFVYSPRVEGVHLRGGKVARGGIRWSDRREDFRTEILGLMKAQMVKNAVIVPVGAKGGFYVKRPPAERDAVRTEAQACYQLFIRGLLDLTDNRVGDVVEKPVDTVRYDEDDPYLVVAADKGTATYSDVANAISIEYGFWLGDAFASGGSAGYDHKLMGITARGAWESVKRHFYEMGRDCQTEPFTCVGVGDMSGDVFGNGMLLSRATRLLAAFDHRHIFIDPDPDPEVSWHERKRLFELPRSSWVDYDLAKISAGGGVWPRSAKSVPLSPEAQAALGVQADSLSPPELMRAILSAPVDLFWNGGIGTFVKARAERHGDAQDRTNDAIRVDAEDLRCKMIGEGGNLGVTQLGRIVFAQGGGRINTDAIDNSAGVDCSDHEVNIKILLDRVCADGDMTLKQRNELLAAMTEEVGRLVLRDNIEQVRALSVRRAEGAAVLDAQAAFMRRLEAEGRLSREVEFLPNDEELAELRQAGRGLTRPELAVLMAYAKTTLYDELLASDLPDDGYFGDDLVAYFPQPLRQRFRPGIDIHRLRREIVATEIANCLANHGQDLFASERRQETGQPGPEIARAYIVARDALGVVDLWEAAERLETVLPAERQLGLLQEIVRVLGFGTRWCLRNLPKSYEIGQMVARYRTGVAVLIERPRDVLPDELWLPVGAVAGELEAAGVDPALAIRFATLPLQVPSFDVAEIASGCEVKVGCATEIYFAIAAALDLNRLRRQFERAEPKDRWTRLALEGLVDDLLAAQRRLTANALNDGLRKGGAVRDWLAREERAIARIGQLVEELETEPTPSLALFGVVVRSLAALSRPATGLAA